MTWRLGLGSEEKRTLSEKKREALLPRRGRCPPVQCRPAKNQDRGEGGSVLERIGEKEGKDRPVPLYLSRKGRVIPEGERRDSSLQRRKGLRIGKRSAEKKGGGGRVLLFIRGGRRGDGPWFVCFHLQKIKKRGGKFHQQVIGEPFGFISMIRINQPKRKGQHDLLFLSRRSGISNKRDNGERRGEISFPI